MSLGSVLLDIKAAEFEAPDFPGNLVVQVVLRLGLLFSVGAHVLRVGRRPALDEGGVHPELLVLEELGAEEAVGVEEDDDGGKDQDAGGQRRDEVLFGADELEHDAQLEEEEAVEGLETGVVDEGAGGLEFAFVEVEEEVAVDDVADEEEDEAEAEDEGDVDAGEAT